jgi:hypothetical protein
MRIVRPLADWDKWGKFVQYTIRPSWFASEVCGKYITETIIQEGGRYLVS